MGHQVFSDKQITCMFFEADLLVKTLFFYLKSLSTRVSLLRE